MPTECRKEFHRLQSIIAPTVKAKSGKSKRSSLATISEMHQGRAEAKWKIGKLKQILDWYIKEYSLEYGTDTMEMHVGAVQTGERALVIDDLIATGGTLAAAVKLLERVGANIVECACVIELADLKGLNDEIGGANGPGKEMDVELGNECVDQDKSVEEDVEVENRRNEENKDKNDIVNEELMNQEHVDNCVVSDEPAMSTGSSEKVKSSYARILNNCLDNKLTLIPTKAGDDGVEVVIFNDEIVKEERTYHWKPGILGVKVLLPVDLGTPLIMDRVTTNMCNMGNGRVGFARVFIEVEACKGLPNQVEIMYKNKDNMETGRKNVKVKYDWKPPVCSFCSVFGHRIENCGLKSRKQTSYNAKQPVKNVKNHQGVVNGNKVDKGSPNGRNVNKEVIDNIRRIANKFSALIDNPNEEGSNVDVNELIEKGGEVVPYLTEYMDFKIASWNARGLGKISKQNAVKNLIFDEKLSIYAILESRLKGSKVKRIGDKVFGRWSWLDNAHVFNKGCRIMVGWDSSKIHCMMIHTSDQAMLCLVEILSTRERLLCTFIHAETVGRLRRQLWADLSTYKSICNNNPWVLMKYVNVSLNFEDHFEGMSYKNQHIQVFQDCVNNLKIDDISSTGLHYTWTKSQLNHNASVLKKIDRVIGNEEFFDVHRRAHVVFLPHEFNQVIEEKWNTDVKGFAIFKLVKKLKAMKLVGKYELEGQSTDKSEVQSTAK
ncbi:RNA-directed DNA polymerase, eukaryota, reverse transcriptase zinc-binding domain protein [Tanacetum coccineum]